MAASELAEWFQRARAHQAENRPVEAQAGYARALRLAPHVADIHFRMGEVFWQLGRFADAVSAWERAAKLAPHNPAAALALGEAQLGLGDLEAAHAAGERAHAAAPADTRAAGILALTRAMRAQRAGDAAAVADEAALLAATLEAHPGLVAIPAFGGMLARAFEHDAGLALPAEVCRRIARVVRDASGAAAPVPAALLAVAAEHAHAEGIDASTLFAAALARAWLPAELDALRRIGWVAARAGAGEAQGLGERYAQACVGEFAAPTPLVWPRRTAGARLRVVFVVPAAGLEPAAQRALADAAALSDTIDACVAVVGGTALPDEGLPAGALRTARVLPLPGVPDGGEAKRIAALDPDVLVDLCGIKVPLGRLLAQAPARRSVSPVALAARHRPPLVEVLPPAVELRGWLEEAARAVARQPTSELDAAATTAQWNGAVQAHQQGDLAAAQQAYDRLLALQPGHAQALYLAAAVRRDAGEPAAAASLLLEALAAAPRYTDAVVAAARLALARNDAAAAVRLCTDGLAAGAAAVPVLRALGLAELARRDGNAAASAFAQALEIEPFDGETHYNLGVAHQMEHRAADAARAYQRALFFNPDLANANFNLGVLYQERKAWDVAAVAYEAVLRADPRHVAAHKNLGEVLRAAGQFDRWFEAFDRFEAACPASFAMAVQGLEVCQLGGNFARLEQFLDGLGHQRYPAADEIELVDALEELLFLLLYFDVEPATAASFARTYDAVARKVYGEPLPEPGERRPGRLRIGYLSADLRDHVMGKMMYAALEHADRARFEQRFYSLSAAEDGWTERFRALADHYEVIADLDERAAAKRIAADDLDVLVDLSTHTKGAKPGILALKPARVQITHVASAGAVGLSTIDFKLTDRYADLPENQEQMIEALLAMDGCVYPYRHIPPAVPGPFDRARLGIRADAFVIGAFVSPLKLSRRCLALWREVLARVPRALIAFSPMSEALRLPFRRLAAAAGIGANRYVFVPQGRDEAENQARYRVVDVVLDPMPYGGVNGTLEALDMGVPVVTLCGRRHGERSAYSILENLGVAATVAHSGREYVDLAVRLAEDPAFMAEVRAAILRGLAHSPLTDRVGHMRALEAAYERAIAAAAERRTQ